MTSGSETDVTNGIQQFLDTIAPGRFKCEERKRRGLSVIDKPVDLQIVTISTKRAIVAIEVANVNSTQLVNEAVRLYYDCCPIKLLILGDRNIPQNGKALCEKVLTRLYSQDKITDTPSRVFEYNEDKLIEAALKELLFLD